MIYSEKDNQGRLNSYKLKRILTADEFDAIWGWIVLMSPVYPSIFTYPPTGYDAYYHAAFLKIIEPAKQGIRAMPTTEEKILGIYTPQGRVLNSLFINLLTISPLIACAATLGIHHRVFFALVMLYVMTFILWLVFQLAGRTKRKQNPFITFNSSNKDM